MVGMDAMTEVLSDANVEAFVRNELRLLNHNKFSEWIDLYTDDGLYFIPIDEDQVDPERYDMIMYDNKPLMQIRKENFGRDDSPSMEYPVRSMRMISDCSVISRSDNYCEAEAPFIASIFYQVMRWYAGYFYYKFVVVEGGIKIKSKQVNLLDMDAPQGPILTYL